MAYLWSLGWHQPSLEWLRFPDLRSCQSIMGLLGILKFQRLELEYGYWYFLVMPTLVELLKHTELPLVHPGNGDKSDGLRKLQGELNKIPYTKPLLAPSKQQISNECWHRPHCLYTLCLKGGPVQTDSQFHPSAPLHNHGSTVYTMTQMHGVPGS